MHPFGFLRCARIRDATLEGAPGARNGALMGVLGDVVDADRERAGTGTRRHRLRNHDLTSAKEKVPRELLTLRDSWFHLHYNAGESLLHSVNEIVPQNASLSLPIAMLFRDDLALRASIGTARSRIDRMIAAASRASCARPYGTPWTRLLRLLATATPCTACLLLPKHTLRATMTIPLLRLRLHQIQAQR